MSARGYIHMDIQIEGLDKMMRALGPGKRIVESEIRPAVSASGKLLKGGARQNASAFSHILPNSVQMRTFDGGMSAVVGSVAKTGLSIERGREKGDQPRVELITRWMGRKGIAAQVEGARVSLKTRRVLGVSKKSSKGRAIGRAQRDLAWKIAMAIKEHGTKPLPFMRPAWDRWQPEINKVMQGALDRIAQRVAGK